MSVATKTVQLVDAKRMIQAAAKKAEELKKPMCVAVVCAGGHLLAFERMEKAWLGSIDIAIKKAWTARAFDAETGDLTKLAAPGGEFFGITASNEGKVMIFAGGLPILQDGVVVGAIGISGGSGKQDQEVAEAGAKAF